MNPRDPHHDGVPVEIQLAGESVARAAIDGATYCCGMTFACWLGAWRDRAGDPDAAPAGLGADDLRDMLATWFCPTMGHPGVHDALVQRGLGRAVPVAEAIPGDLVQFWRSVDLAAPSGHSAVFLSIETGDDGRTRLRYWSSQPATGGVGVHTEIVGRDWRLFTVRPL